MAGSRRPGALHAPGCAPPSDDVHTRKSRHNTQHALLAQDLYDTGCVTRNIKYGVLLYGKARLTLPLDIQVGHPAHAAQGLAGPCVLALHCW